MNPVQQANGGNHHPIERRQAPVDYNPTNSNHPNRSIRFKRPYERTISEKVAQLIPESKLYNDLVTMERKLDAVLLRKKLDFQDQLGSPSKQKRTLRIFLSNTASNQHEDPQNMENFPSWTLKVEGRILDVPTTSHAKKPLNKKFTQFLKSMYISVQPEDGSEPAQLIEWKQQPNQPNFDGLEIKRKGNKNLSCKITLNLSNLIEKFQTSPGLREITNLESATKSEIIGSIWEYLQFNKLQDPNDRLLFHCDALLKRVFGCDNFRFPLLTSILNQHLFPSKPVNLHYTIRVDQEQTISPYAYDVEVEVEDETRAKLSQILGNSQTQKQIIEFDEKIAANLSAITNSKLKREFLQNFSQSPVNFINKWVASQSKNLEVIFGDSQVNLEQVRKGSYFEQDLVPDAVNQYLATKIQKNVANNLPRPM
ncbi:hypothetical protein CONCODRAFT_13131 [Conidiobolus coronatus NRRL 28638]|uniref:DM2 domain-containing protein n=1 Tax=Conidiobolus coronatus (strain ATCC 28846 / CBS 209.66 / NRRL 28638) TaxID=796925 RepID=A0A137NRC7_CONC2|nr:hypothetical protein CONCODRAFT_13131 [Conidiobolus coronatus NRRL 28638]|eukprot:KXN65319.1 hypothetical protein CONCODRAFT_13131 [Conidiobolus coronatus NRRL 28638]